MLSKHSIIISTQTQIMSTLKGISMLKCDHCDIDYRGGEKICNTLVIYATTLHSWKPNFIEVECLIYR